jgi:hypothetical protein
MSGIYSASHAMSIGVGLTGWEVRLTVYSFTASPPRIFMMFCLRTFTLPHHGDTLQMKR